MPSASRPPSVLPLLSSSTEGQTPVLAVGESQGLVSILKMQSISFVTKHKYKHR